ncbi:MAG: hypothetical protein WCT39_06010, partial [Candidatus Margulisiibacteriota bacterium]
KLMNAAANGLGCLMDNALADLIIGRPYREGLTRRNVSQSLVSQSLSSDPEIRAYFEVWNKADLEHIFAPYRAAIEKMGEEGRCAIWGMLVAIEKGTQLEESPKITEATYYLVRTYADRKQPLSFRECLAIRRLMDEILKMDVNQAVLDGWGRFNTERSQTSDLRLPKRLEGQIANYCRRARLQKAAEREAFEKQTSENVWEIMRRVKSGDTVDEDLIVGTLSTLASLEALSGSDRSYYYGSKLSRKASRDLATLGLLLQRDDQVIINALVNALSSEPRNENSESRGGGPRERWVEAAEGLGRLTMMEVQRVLGNVRMGDIEGNERELELVHCFKAGERITTAGKKRLCEIAEKFGRLPAREALQNSLIYCRKQGMPKSKFLQVLARGSHCSNPFNDGRSYLIPHHRELFILGNLFENVIYQHPDNY